MVVAPARGRRPGAGAPRIEPETEEERVSCPFCEGREGQTPPEALALGRADAVPDAPGWTVRVVPNLYPAFERQEVVVHSPRHVRTFAALSDGEVRGVAAAWRARAAAARGEGFPYVHALVNEGRAAGASLSHSHSQLVWLREAPPAVEAETAAGLEALVQAFHAAAEALEIELAADVVAFCHPAGRAPYETTILNPYAVDPSGLESDLLPQLLLALRNVVRRLRAVEGVVPWNAWVHTLPSLHLELVPRLSVPAGIELGAGIYVNAVAPEEAAAALRAAAV